MQKLAVFLVSKNTTDGGFWVERVERFNPRARASCNQLPRSARCNFAALHFARAQGLKRGKKVGKPESAAEVVTASGQRSASRPYRNRRAWTPGTPIK
jgi:hypothetical protein